MDSILIDVFYTCFSQPLPNSLWNEYLDVLPRKMQEKNAKYLRWQDRHSHLFGQLLLISTFKKYGYNQDSLNKVTCDSYGRPFLNTEIDFNISHSGGEVLCAITKGIRLGIDVEEIKKINFDHFENVMNDSQWKEIRNSIDPLKTFFKYWTIKESIIKADGRGLSIPLTHIDVSKNIVKYDSNTWYLTKINTIQNSSAYLSTSAKDIKINFIHLNFYDRSSINL